jgi:hypothetical protein
MTAQEDGWVDDQTLLEALAAAGFDRIGASQLERWRKVRVLPKRRQRGRGRGHGRTRALSPPGTIAQALALSELLQERRSLDGAALHLFLHGYPVDPRLAAMRILARYHDRLLRRHHSNDPGEIADGEARRLARGRWRNSERREWVLRLRAWQRSRPRAERERMSALLESVLSTLLTVFLGGSPSRQGVEESLRAVLPEQLPELLLPLAARLDGIATLASIANSPGPLAALLETFFPRLRYESLQAAVATAELEELLRWRDLSTSTLALLGGGADLLDRDSVLLGIILGALISPTPTVPNLEEEPS